MGTAPSVVGQTWHYRAIFIAMLVGLHGVFAFFPELLDIFGVSRLGIWFRDSYAMLAASDAAAEGLNPFVNNPYDLVGERHIYSDWWYVLGKAGFTRADYLVVGGCVVFVFWVAVVRVLPLHSWRAIIWAFAICASPPVMLAVNRANPDILVFAIMTLAVPLLSCNRRLVRHLAAIPVALAAGLKYYPIIAGLVLLQWRDQRERWERLAILGGLVGLLGWLLKDAIGNYIDAGWVARGQFVFGAMAIPANYGLLTEASPLLDLGRLVGVAIVVGAWLYPGPACSVLGVPADRKFALMGAAVLAGNFFLTIGYLYKAVFLIWLLPLGLAWSQGAGRHAIWVRVLMLVALVMVWTEGVVCVTSPVWLEFAGADGGIMVRRGASVLTNIAAWFVVGSVTVLMCRAIKTVWLKEWSRTG